MLFDVAEKINPSVFHSLALDIDERTRAKKAYEEDSLQILDNLAGVPMASKVLGAVYASISATGSIAAALGASSVILSVLVLTTALALPTFGFAPVLLFRWWIDSCRVCLLCQVSWRRCVAMIYSQRQQVFTTEVHKAVSNTQGMEKNL